MTFSISHFLKDSPQKAFETFLNNYKNQILTFIHHYKTNIENRINPDFFALEHGTWDKILQRNATEKVKNEKFISHTSDDEALPIACPIS